jgi:hypothetical protein
MVHPMLLESVLPEFRCHDVIGACAEQKAVEHLSHREVAESIALLEQQGRITEIADPTAAHRRHCLGYAANPDNTVVVSPDNASRREIPGLSRSVS